MIGLLVDRTGFPLEISRFEGNTAETTTILTILTILKRFQKRHNLAAMPMMLAADAAMLSWTNLKAIDTEGFSFTITINGTSQTFAPHVPDAQAEILAHLGIEVGH